MRNDDGLHANPNPDYAFQGGELLGVLGTAEQRCAARDMICADTAPAPTIANHGVGEPAS